MQRAAPLPAKFNGRLPTVEQLEAEHGKEDDN
jgi:hypothetical protein